MHASSTAKAGRSALEGLVDAASGILAADSLQGTLGRIAHHLAALVPHDDLTVYETDARTGMLRPVFAIGNWVEEVMNDVIRPDEGATGWAIRNRRRATSPTPCWIPSARRSRVPTTRRRRSSSSR